MHGHSPGSALLVNAEVDSMGGVIDGGVAIDSKTSPRLAAIEKAQADLRQEYDVREERRRELEFLEKGGNPLDFKFGPATSVSVQSTSLRDQLAVQFVTSEAKGSFALTASPHGDSVESSGRPGAPTGHESNSADNLLLFDGENDLLERERNSVNPSRSNIAPSEQSSQLDGNHNAKESEDSIMFRLVVKSQAYARRNRSRSNRDSARVCSTDLVPVRDSNGSSTLPASHHGLRDSKGSVCEANTRKDHAVSSICKAKSTSSNGNVVLKTLAFDNQLDMELDAAQAPGTVTALIKIGPLKGDSDVEASKDMRNSEHNQHPQVDAQQIPFATAFMAPGFVEVTEGVSTGLEFTSCAATAKVENQTSFDELNGFSNLDRDEKPMQNLDQNSSAVFSTKELESEFSCTQISLSVDGNNANNQCPNLRNGDSNGNTKEWELQFEGTPGIADANMIKEKSEIQAVDAVSTINDHNYVHQNHSNNGSQCKVEEGTIDSRPGLQNEVKSLPNIERMEPNDHTVSKAERKPGELSGDNSNSKRASLCSGISHISMDFSNCELPKATFSGRHLTAAPELQNHAENQLKLVNKAHEDSILEEARIIEAKRKRIAELSVGTLPLENQRKSHWDYVLEEMAWLANDFMQERVWKTTAAAQISNQVAFTGRLRFDEKNLRLKQREVAHTLAKAIMQFWHSTEVLLNSDDPSVGLKNCESDLLGSRITDGSEAVENRIAEPNKVIIIYFS
ncbi:hypothetical protein HHK36_020310 [Tetracentron sinense]|uniref:HSA domain-containing protein n=1 Tax=Tetracentron sinense TaxID=13715 RepID=A0A834YUX9_TETSI|nr:hypothetical protein HHK36_020310 [Tetracentron sinense]